MRRPALVLAYAVCASGAGFYEDPDPELQALRRAASGYDPTVKATTTTPPPAPVTHLQVLTEQAQVLKLGKLGNCVSTKGQLVRVTANYHTTDGRAASALSFAVKWDPAFLEPVGAHKEHTPSGCVVNDLVVDNAAGTASYTCASPAAVDIVPNHIEKVLTVTLRSTGKEGNPFVSIQPNAKLPGNGYSYARSQPINLGCDRNNETQLQKMYATCPAGTFGRAIRWRESGTDVQMAKAKCVPCPVGRYNGGDSMDDAQCKPCAAGSFADQERATACKTCAAGRFAPRPGMAGCSKCPKGRHAASAGASACNLCGVDKAGVYADVEGLSACKVCPDGTFAWVAGATACGVGEGCSPGRYHARSTVHGFDCEACPIGKYQPAMNSVACLDCEAGQYQIQPGENECERAHCKAGTFYDATVWPGCRKCPSGKFSISKGGALFPGTGCLACPVGQYQSRRGQQSCYESKCLPGSYQFKYSKECVACAAGQFQPFAGRGSCEKCPIGTHNTAGGTSCESIENNAALKAAFVRSSAPGPCTHMVCRLEAHRCHTAYLKTGFQRGKVVRDCTSRNVDEHGLEAAKHDHTAGHWVSIRSYHQTAERKGTRHKCGFDKKLGKCECICWADAPASEPEAP